MSPRIAIATADWPSTSDGGVGSLMATLALGLQRCGAHVTVFTRGGGARSAEALRTDRLGPWPALAAEVVALPGRSWARWGDHHWRRGLRGRLGAFDALIVARHDELGGVRPVLPDGLPAAVFAHGRDITATLPPARDRRRSRAFEAPVSWLCLTDWMRGELADRGVRTSARVPAAVPEAPNHAPGALPPADDGGILSVGRLIRRKGHDVLLEALRRMEHRVPVVIVGDGPDRGRLSALAARLGVADRVEFTGWLPAAALERRWADAAVFALPCRTEAGGDTEGFGLVFLEAAARGRAAVAGGEGGAREAVAHGRTGLVLGDPRDPEALAAALDRLMGDPVLRRQYGEAGHAAHARAGLPEHLGAAVLGVLGVATVAA